MEDLIKLSEHIYYLKYDEVGDRPNLYYIKGKDYSVCIDAGNSKRHIEKFYSALKQNNLEDPRYTIITHWHWDHTFGLKYAKGERISSIKNQPKNSISDISDEQADALIKQYQQQMQQAIQTPYILSGAQPMAGDLFSINA